MIQNVTSLSDGREDKIESFRRAINVAYKWYLEKINLGYNVEPFQNESIPSYVVYGIGLNNQPIVIENRAIEKHDEQEGIAERIREEASLAVGVAEISIRKVVPNYLQILTYSIKAGKYAAMLPLGNFEIK